MRASVNYCRGMNVLICLGRSWNICLRKFMSILRRSMIGFSGNLKRL